MLAYFFKNGNDKQYSGVFRTATNEATNIAKEMKNKNWKIKLISKF